LCLAAGLQRFESHTADGVLGGKIQRHVLQGYFGFAHLLALSAAYAVLFTNPAMLYSESGTPDAPQW
jgi:hypothetical protein